ncbi:DNA-directed RNA polymerase subunit alpha C-terminal domain-containing protein [Bacillus solimangrovi]|uniref:RNA polymerase alpha subunit C-terminal domain-containing protein n=1 Tax=Bacillus solimangrovi TaxID=1305675 RepID=A0A1E5LF42_9BACI|nr:DNA-directed RNA polymerase subunit alpha C-terminal domain-containing protein [Bacillus solimangrovi]OEH92701.1 hypothetical protein BFG57_01465 [Bacillus solimangrovi]
MNKPVKKKMYMLLFNRDQRSESDEIIYHMKLTDDTPIEKMQLTVRTYTILKQHGVHSVGQVRNLTMAEIQRMHNIHEKCIDELSELLKWL